jgi:hypothetical protein
MRLPRRSSTSIAIWGFLHKVSQGFGSRRVRSVGCTGGGVTHAASRGSTESAVQSSGSGTPTPLGCCVPHALGAGAITTDWEGIIGPKQPMGGAWLTRVFRESAAYPGGAPPRSRRTARPELPFRAPGQGTREAATHPAQPPRSGSTTVNVLPRPGSDSTSIRPP